MMATAIPPLKESEQLEFGYAQPSADTTKSQVSGGKTIVVASYNIRYAVGSFLISGGLLRKAGLGRPRRRKLLVARKHSSALLWPLRKAGFFRRQMSLALQEADKETKRAGGHHVARELAEALQMNWIHVPAGIPRGVKPKTRQWWLDFEEQIDLHDTGDTGVALLSRLPLSDVTRIDLPWHECAWRPRLALAATVSVGVGKLRILNAHVDPHAAVGGQLEQLEVLVAQAQADNGPTLILGDFNTLSKPKIDETRAFLESRGFSTPFPTGTPTWRGTGIRLHADWIFSRGVGIAKWGVGRPLNVSDHWPIWAEVEISN